MTKTLAPIKLRISSILLRWLTDRRLTLGVFNSGVSDLAGPSNWRPGCFSFMEGNFLSMGFYGRSLGPMPARMYHVVW